jgi:hypothetical protein
MTPRESILSRIRALKARTATAGCTQAEAEAAADLVARLMREHGVSELDTLVAEARCDAPKQRVAQLLFRSVATLCGCEVYLAQRHGQSWVCYLGQAPFQEVAAYMHDVVFGAVARAARDFTKHPDWKRRRTPRTKAAAREAFLCGFVDGLRRRLAELAAQSQAELAPRLALAQQALDAKGPMGTSKVVAKPPGRGHTGTYLAGRQAASDVGLGWGVNGPAATRALAHG